MHPPFLVLLLWVIIGIVIIIGGATHTPIQLDANLIGHPPQLTRRRSMGKIIAALFCCLLSLGELTSIVTAGAAPPHPHPPQPTVLIPSPRHPLPYPSPSPSPSPPPSQPLPRPPGAAKAKGYVTDQRQDSPNSVVNVNCAGGGSSCAGGGGGGGYDFNPELLGGSFGNPGIKARVNTRGFQYFSALLAPILNQQIKQARIPNINQCLPAPLNGCIQVYNIYVSRYRCPQRIILFPAPPNLIVLSVENLDIGVTGNLGGQINILIPIALYGIVQLNAHQLSLRVSLVIDRSPTGGIAIRMAGCYVSVGYVDVYIENGGLVGDIANSQFRGKISEMVRDMLPSRICQQLPSIINEKLNGQLTSIPQSIALTQLLQIALTGFGLEGIFGGGGSIGGGGKCGSSPCSKAAAAAAPKSPVQLLIPVPESALQKSTPPNLPTLKTVTMLPRLIATLPPVGAHLVAANRYLLLPTAPKETRHYNETVVVPNGGGGGGGAPRVLWRDDVKAPSPQVSPKHRDAGRMALNPTARPPPSRTAPPFVSSGSVQAPYHHPQPRIRSQSLPSSKNATRTRTRRQAQLAAPAPQTRGVVVARARAHAPSPNHVIFPDPNAPNPCINCPGGGTQNPLAFLLVVLQSLDFSKLSNIYLTVQLLQSYATYNDYTIELNGEFSPNGAGGTPFGAFPMYFPEQVGSKMADILISDWTVNSLFYHLHRSGFLTIRLGPETPKIGDLLKTTCSNDNDDDGGLEDHGVETDEHVPIPLVKGRRRKRQNGNGGLTELGICFGDILPTVRDRYPHQRIVIVIRTARAPSVVLSARNGGTATLDIVLNADLYIQETNQQVGTIQLAATVAFTVRTGGGRISAHADILQLSLRDVGNQLGIPQESLDNLGNLGKEIILKAGNEALERGAPLNIPQGVGGLPINIVDPEIRIVEHALAISTDFTIDPSALSTLGGGGGGGYCTNG